MCFQDHIYLHYGVGSSHKAVRMSQSCLSFGVLCLVDVRGARTSINPLNLLARVDAISVGPFSIYMGCFECLQHQLNGL